MEEELRSHIAHRADDLEHSGVGRAEAERRARIEFGGYERYQQESYEATGGHFFERLAQDVRIALTGEFAGLSLWLRCSRWPCLTARDLLLVVQIAICAVLVTSSLVAVRGLMRSLHSNFGFQPQGAMLVDTDLDMAGYSGDQAAINAAARDRCGGGDSRRECRGTDRPAASWRGVEHQRCIQGQRDRQEAIE
jgi:hypothetical protein